MDGFHLYKNREATPVFAGMLRGLRHNTAYEIRLIAEKTNNTSVQHEFKLNTQAIPAIVAATGATIIAEYDNGEPLIIVKNQIGPKNVSGAFLNFFPPSSDERNDFWDVTTNGDLILANSLKWVGNK